LDCRDEARALVIHTGYTSRRGRIIRKITNKVTVEPEMFKNAIYFLLESLAVGIIVYLVTLPILLAANITAEFRIYRFFDFIGFSFPPAIPIYFNVSYSFALYRLRKKEIYGT
jgi:cation-transporting ATPase 13A3/4/5